MHPKESLRYLLAMAAADGGVRREELEFLADRALTWGVTDDEFETVLDEAVAGTAELTLPTTREEKFEILRELIFMMAADGRVGDWEKNLLAELASRMRISGEDINQIIDDALAEHDRDCGAG